MSLSRIARFSLGVATGLLVLGHLLVPIVFVLLALVLTDALPIESETMRSTLSWLTEAPWNAAIPLSLLLAFTFILLVIYVFHAGRNSATSSTWRTAFIVAMLFLPSLAMPAYYLTYIAPSDPPTWAIEATDGSGRRGTICSGQAIRYLLFVATLVVILVLSTLPVLIIALVIYSVLGPAIAGSGGFLL